MKIGNLEQIAEEEVFHNITIKKRVMLRNDEIPHITQFAQARFPSGEITGEHSHQDMYEVFLVEKGEGKIKVNGESYSLQKGSYIIVEPGETHEITSNKELVLIYFGLKV